MARRDDAQLPRPRSVRLERADAERLRRAREHVPERRPGPLKTPEAAGQAPARRKDDESVGVALNVVVVVLAVAVAACVALLAMRSAGVFRIERLDAPATAHLSSDDIARLANVGQGTTLLTVDVDKVEAGVMGDPWVKSVEVERVFPDTLRVSVTERGVTELVLMGSGTLAWYVGEGDVWCEPVALASTGDSSTLRDRALALADENGALLVTDVPATVSPEAGSTVSDEALLAVDECMQELPQELRDQVASFSAPGADALSCLLKNGVEVSLGSSADAATKGEIVLDLLARHPGEITYINVRSITNPSYRSIDSDSVTAGTGTSAPTTTEATGAGAGDASGTGADAAAGATGTGTATTTGTGAVTTDAGAAAGTGAATGT